MAANPRTRPFSYPPAVPPSQVKGPVILETNVALPIQESVSAEHLVPPPPLNTSAAPESTNSEPPPNAEKARDDPKQKPIWRQWFFEIGSCVVSLSAFTIIVAVLRSYDGRSLPKLPMSITLNTFLAFFTTLSKAAFMSPISEATGQWKWNILVPTHSRKEKRRHVHDFDVLDNATRATWGSWLVIWNFRWRHFVSLAALLSILSIFVSPITQQLIAYHDRPALSPDIASVPFTRGIFSPAGTPDRDSALNDLIQATSAGLTSRISGGQAVGHIDATCASTNCTFGPYSSLGVCMKIKDISHLVTVETYQDGGWEVDDYLNQVKVVMENLGKTPPVNRARNASLPNGAYHLTPFSYSFALILNDKTLAFNDSENDDATSFLNLFLIYSKAGNVTILDPEAVEVDTGPWEFGAVEIMYYVCVNTYSTFSFRGNSTTEITGESNVPLARPGNLPVRNARCMVRETSGTTCVEITNYDDTEEEITYLQDPDAPDDPNSFYSIGRRYSFSLTNVVGAFLRNKLFWDGTPDGELMSSTPNFLIIMQALDYWRPKAQTGPNGQLLETPLQGIEGLETYFRGMAVSLSNMMRVDISDSQLHYGQTWVNETFVHISWGWVVFLAVEMVLSFLFVATTIYRTVKLNAPVLKTSELATLLVSTDEVRQQVGSIDRLEDAEANARTVAVKLEGTKMVLA